MLQLGPAGSAGYEPGVLPVFWDGAVIAAMRITGDGRPVATVALQDQEWVFTSVGREIHGRLTKDPEGVVRYRGRQVAVLRDTWQIDMEGTPVEMRSAWLSSDHRFLVNGAVVAESAIVDRRVQLHGGAGLSWPQLLFLFWLDLSARRRYAASAAAI